MKKILPLILGVLMLIQIAYAGVTNPLPTELNLFKGEEGRFKFQIQAVTSDQDLGCLVSSAEDSPIKVLFDYGKVIVPAGTIKEVYGTIRVPEDAKQGQYETKFCVSCGAVEAGGGTTVRIDTCDLPIKVNVISERTKENMNVPSKEPPTVLYLIIIITFISIVAIYLWSKGLFREKLKTKKKRNIKTNRKKAKKPKKAKKRRNK